MERLKVSEILSCFDTIVILYKRAFWRRHARQFSANQSSFGIFPQLKMIGASRHCFVGVNCVVYGWCSTVKQGRITNKRSWVSWYRKLMWCHLWEIGVFRGQKKSLYCEISFTIESCPFRCLFIVTMFRLSRYYCSVWRRVPIFAIIIN